MPSFFKNIKKLFAKPEQQKAAPASTKTTSDAPKKQRRNDPAPVRENPYLDHARAAAINANVIDESTHKIKFRDIDNNAVKIVKDLHNANYESYLVGGCVRDLLLHKRPKDFDVTTGAHPEQAHKVFNRSRLIGRRFKLLHVRFGREIIEVATFRAAHENTLADNHAKQADSGMILRDNVYGTIDQDAIRRDFTINALYYDIKSRAIYDFTNGYQDINERKIRMIGDPSERYREDPVRMLRAIRFAAKLDFTIDQATAAPIKELSPMLFDIAPARLFDEVLKLLQSGHGNASLALLQEYNLLETILPQTAVALENDSQNAKVLIHNALKNTDRRLKQRKSVSPGFLYAVLLWPSVQEQLQQVLANKRVPPLSALHDVASKVILDQVKRTSIPKRFSSNIREIWELQLRLCRKQGNKVEQLIEHPRFRAAYDLLVLREKSGEDIQGMGEWWTQYQSANADEKEQMRETLAQKKAPAKKKRTFKSETAKGELEKFDIVEQVAPKSRKQAKAKVAPTPEQATLDNAKAPVNTAATVNNAERIEQTTEEPVQESLIEQPKKAAEKVQSSTQTDSKTEQSIEAPIVETVEEPETAPTPSTATATTTPEPRRKPRRGRAKNDPRNK